MIASILAWLTDPAHSADIWRRLGEHVQYSLVATLLAALVAIPLGLWIGHTGRGQVVAVGAAGAARAIPSLGLLYLFVVWLGPHFSGEAAFYVPNMLVLVILAIPPILSGTYAGISAVDPATRDAAVGMGMRGRQVLTDVELPIAVPLMCSGLQSALLQVIATATIAANAGMGGLGRFLIDGLAVRDYYQMAAGAVLVAVLALLVDILMSALRRAVTSPGLGGGLRRPGRGRAHGRGPDAADTAPDDPAPDDGDDAAAASRALPARP